MDAHGGIDSVSSSYPRIAYRDTAPDLRNVNYKYQSALANYLFVYLIAGVILLTHFLVRLIHFFISRIFQFKTNGRFIVRFFELDIYLRFLLEFFLFGTLCLLYEFTWADYT